MHEFPKYPYKPCTSYWYVSEGAQSIAIILIPWMLGYRFSMCDAVYISLIRFVMSMLVQSSMLLVKEYMPNQGMLSKLLLPLLIGSAVWFLFWRYI